MAKPTDLVPDTLDLLILRTLALRPMHGWGMAQRIRQVSKEALTPDGAKYLRQEQAQWKRHSLAIVLVLERS